jgi:hypothetical protein
MTPKDLDHLHQMRTKLMEAHDQAVYLMHKLDGVAHDSTTTAARQLMDLIDDAVTRLDAVTGSLVGSTMRAAEESSTNMLTAMLAGHTLGSKR